MDNLIENKDLKKKKILIISSIISTLIILLGSVYAFFTYFKSAEAFTLTSNSITATFTSGSNQINFTNAYPISDAYALSNLDKLDYIDFTVNGSAVNDSEAISYEIFLTEASGNTLSNSYIKTYLTDNNGSKITDPTMYSNLTNTTYSNEPTGKVVVTKTYKGTFTKSYRLYIWLDSTYEQNTVSQDFSFYVNIYAYNNTSDNAEISGAEKVLAAVTAKEEATPSCGHVTWTDPEDNITYISGSATCIDFNYVWYSGKLWRITAIYPDGSMKLVTENAITAIFWGSNVEYDGSYMYQWLNEDFLDTLYPKVTYNEQTHEYSHPVLKTNAVWNYSTDSNSTPVRPETIATQKTKTSTVGLLNAYEYYNSYRCNGSSACTGSTYGSGYLNKSVWWWLITPYSGSNVRNVNSDGNLNCNSPSSSAGGARPSIILQSNIPLSGSGTKNDPYRLVGVDESANVGDNLYSRYSGEYVNFNGEKYRIVSIDENNITKLTKFDYIKDGTTVVTKNFASSVYFGKDSNTKENTFWDYYLNNNYSGGWLYSIPTTYKNMMVDGTYYLGWYGSSNVNYKATVCSDSASTLNSTTINNCTKYTSQDTDKTFTGKVGLPRVGEMFSAQLKVGTNSYSIMWLITPYSGSRVRLVSNYGRLSYSSPSSVAYGARPSITLSSSVKIACTNNNTCDGTEEHPYDLSCTNCQSQ